MDKLFYLLGMLTAYAIIFGPGILIVRNFGRSAGIFYAFFLFVGFMIFVSTQAKAETYYTFNYKTKDELKISVPATDYFEARTKASKLCFQALTGGKYQGEEESLRIIDVCANPGVK